MRKSVPANQEAVDRRLTEEIHKMCGVSLREGAAKCQMRGFLLYEGNAVIVYVFQPAGEVILQARTAARDGDLPMPDGGPGGESA